MSTSLTQPFSILASCVRQFELSGKPCIGALLKPKFLQAIGGGVTERTLGFSRFGEFLRAAQTAGFVRVADHPGGDLEVSLPASPPNVQQLSLVEIPLEQSKEPESLASSITAKKSGRASATRPLAGF